MGSRREVHPDDWFRSDGWSAAEQEHFEAKLQRARDRAEYLRIKGLTLLETGDPLREAAGEALLERLIRDYAADEHSVAGAQAHLAHWHARHGRIDAAAARYESTLAAEAGKNFSHGAELDLASLIAEHRRASEYDHAERLLDAEIDDPAGARLLFRDAQYQYSVARSRIASSRGQADRAAAFAMGALWLVAANGPAAARHPDVGLIDDDSARGEHDELWSIVEGGNPEAASALVEGFRGSDGVVRWEWALTKRLHEVHEPACTAGLSPGVPRRGDATAAVLAELRAAGFEVFDLARWSLKALPSTAQVRIAVPILLRALEGPDDGELHWNALDALGDRRARNQATVPMIERFRDVGLSAGPYASAIGNRIASFARDEHLSLLEPMIRDPRFGSDRAYLWWAVGYMKSEAAVDLAIEMVGDEETGISALRALVDIKSERAAPTLQALANRAPVKLTRKQTQWWLRGEDPDAFVRDAERRNAEIEIATRGLERLEKARAAGKSRHAG